MRGRKSFHADSTPQAVEACHALLLWLIPQLDKFPRARRFTLGERLEGSLLQVLELPVQAAFTRVKREPLERANLRLEIARHLWRLAHELMVISTRGPGVGTSRNSARPSRLGTPATG